MHQGKSLALCLLYHYGEYRLLPLLVLGKKQQARAIPSLFWHRYSLQQNKLMRYLHHYASTIPRLVARLGTAMLHVFEHTQGIVNQLVALSAVNVHHHAHTTRIMLIAALV